MKLQTEGGVTRISLDNAKVLIAGYGLPDSVELYQAECECIVEATWSVTPQRPEPVIHEFSGFSWGYGGEGPHGLFKFLGMLNMRIPLSMDAIGRMPQENFPSLTFVKGEDYEQRRSNHEKVPSV